MPAPTTMPDAARMKRELAALVAIDSQNPPGREIEAARLVGGWLRAAAFDVEVDEYRPDRANIVARLANGPGPVFTFNTHLDVVPAGDGWSSDPFSLREHDGRLYGRGTCDCKGPLAAMIEAMRMLAAERARWSGTLLGVFVADEEVASEGAKRFAAGRPKIDLAVVGEPTSNATVTAHKGSLRPLVRVHGTAAHSGAPERGDNAVYRAAKLVGLVEQFHETTVRLRRHDLVGPASLTITRIDAGVADNVLPDRCDLLLDRRTLPGEDEAVVKAEIDGLLAVARTRFGVRAEVVEWRPTTGGATETPDDPPIVAAALDACARHGSRTPGPFGFQGACDLVHFTGLGADGVVIGPGSLAVAHRPDEFVPVDEFIAASLVYRDVALALLGATG
jgi:acetylornithine deacetylase/succinyl-diaminopimelate desuccinylase family protein